MKKCWEVHCICLKAVASEFVALDNNQKQLWHFHKLRLKNVRVTHVHGHFVYVVFSEIYISFKF